jgi:hypothetical protein
MYKVTFTNAHLENRTIEYDYLIELSGIPAKGSMLTLDSESYRVGDAHWVIDYDDSPMNRGRHADVSVKIELFPVPFN